MVVLPGVPGFFARAMAPLSCRLINTSLAVRNPRCFAGFFGKEPEFFGVPGGLISPVDLFAEIGANRPLLRAAIMDG
jgi:hypothetical protein